MARRHDASSAELVNSQIEMKNVKKKTLFYGPKRQSDVWNSSTMCREREWERHNRKWNKVTDNNAQSIIIIEILTGKSDVWRGGLTRRGRESVSCPCVCVCVCAVNGGDDVTVDDGVANQLYV